ncbi:uncharacterized protein BJ171DRAFT_570743 [Polychytrium aggregatum]|uniref:uncharacterized protein n=1 Tax=Polychytrium aggregatum TaxID=110093 RepID=UPI0022FEF708|nr:uncharacterized protein BJ171DRAFT_570743 [Polychytrium aggregatum]KAI9197340.1 hypothetical protein BJ171DRAFT_570743 [Polychytrium aggregatum]
MSRAVVTLRMHNNNGRAFSLAAPTSLFAPWAGVPIDRQGFTVSRRSNPQADGMNVVQASEIFDGVAVHFQVVVMADSLIVWAGKGDGPSDQQQRRSASDSAPTGRLGSLALAMPNLGNGVPTSTKLFGASLDERSESMAKRLAAKFKKQFFVTIDLPSTPDGIELSLFAEKKLVQVVKDVLER